MFRILMAGIVGGIVIFIWGAVSHMLLPLGKMGIQQLPSEEVLMPALKTAIPEPGLYIFPGEDKSKPDDTEAWEAKIKAGPRGMLVINPLPTEQGMLSMTQLGRELTSNILAALIAAMIVSLMTAATITRVFAVAAFGLFGWLSISVSHWNWYGFPSDFTLAELMGEVVGWTLAGLFIVPIVSGFRVARNSERP